MALKKIAKNLMNTLWGLFPSEIKNSLKNFYDLYLIRGNKNKAANKKFRECFILNTRGLFASCDTHNKYQISSSKNIDFNIVKETRKIYVCSDAIERFQRFKLKHIRNNFCLYTGDSDLTISVKEIDKKIIDAILENPYLDTWYAQNLDYSHPKLINLPIGIDYHSDYYNLDLSPQTQEETLKSILSKAKKTRDRKKMAYCNWHFELDRGDRKQCFNSTPKEICFYEPYRIIRKKVWENQSKYAFCLSPEGAGLDCHRTYEAIFLGSVPIIRKNCLSKMFSNLPIVLVDNYKDISRSFLSDQLGVILEKKYDFSSLMMATYSDSLLPIQDKLTFDDFQEVLSEL